MKITHQKIAEKLIDYLHHRITLSDLVDWAEEAMREAEFDEAGSKDLVDIVGLVGLADVREFGLTWEDCESFLSRLGYRVNITVQEIPELV